jgi:hypothetical protein
LLDDLDEFGAAQHKRVTLPLESLPRQLLRRSCHRSGSLLEVLTLSRIHSRKDSLVVRLLRGVDLIVEERLDDIDGLVYIVVVFVEAILIDVVKLLAKLHLALDQRLTLILEATLLLAEPCTLRLVSRACLRRLASPTTDHLAGDGVGQVARLLPE